MADPLIEEINDAIRRDRMEQFWRRTGHYIIGGSLGVLLATIGVVVWQNHLAGARQEWAGDIRTAQVQLEAKDFAGADAALKEARSNADGELLAITRLWEAHAALKQKQPENALLALKDTSGTSPYHAFAQLLERYYSREPGGEAPAIFRFTAMEQDAIRLWEAGKKPEAQALFQSIAKDALAPASMRERATLLMGTAPAAPVAVPVAATQEPLQGDR